MYVTGIKLEKTNLARYQWLDLGTRLLQRIGVEYNLQ